jgi:hypothetical protein
MNRVINIIILLSILAIYGCGGGSSSSTATSSGSFIDAPVQGLTYTSLPSGLTGTTDSSGTYSYQSGDTVTFKLNVGSSSLTIGSTSSPSSTTSVLSITPPTGGSALGVAQILQTLDTGNDSSITNVSGLTSIPSSTVTTIQSALSSSSISSSTVSTIATVANTSGISLKNGTSGVTQATAVSNLAQNTANQTLVKSLTNSLANDGSAITAIQDKTAFTVWTVSGGTFSTWLGMGKMTSGGVYDYRAPLTGSNYYGAAGTYILSNSNKTGTWTSTQNNCSQCDSGTFNIVSADSNAYLMTYKNNSTGESGSFAASLLQPITLSDIVSKTFSVVDKNCTNSINTVTFNSTALMTQSCYSESSTWSAGYYTNTLQYTDSSGNIHTFGVIRISKPSGSTGNMPISATGTMVEIDSTNYTSAPHYTDFTVKN